MIEKEESRIVIKVLIIFGVVHYAIVSLFELFNLFFTNIIYQLNMSSYRFNINFIDRFLGKVIFEEEHKIFNFLIFSVLFLGIIISWILILKGKWIFCIFTFVLYTIDFITCIIYDGIYSSSFYEMISLTFKSIGILLFLIIIINSIRNILKNSNQ